MRRKIEGNRTTDTSKNGRSCVSVALRVYDYGKMRTAAVEKRILGARSRDTIPKAIEKPCNSFALL